MNIYLYTIYIFLNNNNIKSDQGLEWERKAGKEVIFWQESIIELSSIL